jgi:hypothetical protein
MATMPEQHVIARTDFTIVIILIERPAVFFTFPLFGLVSILLNATTVLRDCETQQPMWSYLSWRPPTEWKLICRQHS